MDDMKRWPKFFVLTLKTIDSHVCINGMRMLSVITNGRFSITPLKDNDKVM